MTANSCRLNGTPTADPTNQTRPRLARSCGLGYTETPIKRELSKPVARVSDAHRGSHHRPIYSFVVYTCCWPDDKRHSHCNTI
ncbi:unnamed protein product [Protopolystoma xenopodis]|uniref:Uncharacterized protein n=1 Tax=Protopolystoma xenopodis TaxID=117903 RepID=A0A3S5CI68_9PLAT|nr:unnamed protein product [Protopolystoma xenopodis]